MTNPLRTFPWVGLPILDACCVHASYGQLLLLTSDGTLYGLNFDTGASVRLCAIDLPDLARDDVNPFFGAPAFRLHASSDGGYAAVVVDKGRQGFVVDTVSGSVTMQLDGGEYHEDTVPFSACFLPFEGRDVLVHRTEWNRLDVADPVTGKSLVDRYIAPYTADGGVPAHYLDYFHGKLRPSPDGSRIFDDGWVWQPVSVPRTWSVTQWLRSNPWESEDGASIVDLTMRDDWNAPACWISDKHIALWNLAHWDEEEFEETGHGTGVRILDATKSEQSSDGRWPMDTNEQKVLDLFSDGKHLCVAADTGTTIWDLDSRSRICSLPGFTARLHDMKRGTLVAFDAATIIEFSL